MSKRLYYVSIEIEVPVVAESEEEARDYGIDAIRDEVTMNVHAMDLDVRVAKAGEKYLPAGYEKDSLVYGETVHDLPLEEAWKLNS